MTCPGLKSGPVVQFIRDTDPIAGKSLHGAASDSRLHLAILDVGGTTVIV